MAAELLSRSNALSTCDDVSERVHTKAHTLGPLTLFERELRRAQQWIRIAPFYLAIELQKEGEPSRAFFVSKGEDPSTFAEQGLVGPLTPIGRLALEVKNDLKDGRVPRPHTFQIPLWRGGPLNRTVWTPRGAAADVTFDATQTRALARELTLWDVEGKGQPLLLSRQGTQTAATEAPPHLGFGLVDVIASIDIDQLRSIDFPDDGTLVVTGSAGTGKTTVAMYRASYLLSEQADAIRDDPGASVYFRPSQFIVLVRKDHLRPYLERLAVEMRMPPGVRVDTFDRWFQEKIFRPYLRRDQKKVVYSEQTNDLWEQWTSRLNENDIRSYLEEKLGAIARPLIDRFAKASELLLADVEAQPRSGITEARRLTLDLLINQWKTSVRRIAIGKPWAPTAILSRFDIGVQVHRDVRTTLRDSDLSLWERTLSGRLESNMAEAARAREEFVRTACRPDSLVRDFYKSAAFQSALRRDFSSDVTARAAQELGNGERAFCRADEPVVLWLLDELTAGMGADAPAHLRPIPTYDHVVVDEAQYYPSAVLRFLSRLAKAPRSAVTIVGDLDQRFHSNVGPRNWNEVLAEGQSDRIKRLQRLYRCSKEIYAFLFDLQGLLGLQTVLTPPREVDRFSGDLPRIVVAKEQDDEINWLGDQIEAIRNKNDVTSVAVILGAFGDSSSFREALVNSLTARGVPSRWALGEDMKESNEKVMVTTSEFVVGLEFDNVLVPGIDRFWPTQLDQHTGREFWVSATRAKRSLTLSGTSVPHWLGTTPIGGVLPTSIE